MRHVTCSLYSFFTAVGLLVVSTGSVSPVHATLAVADFNDLQAGALHAQAGGEGVRGGWFGSGRIFVIPGGLSSDKYGIDQPGPSAMAVQGDFNAPRSVARHLCCEMSGEIWFSFLVNLPEESSRAGITWNWTNTTGVPTTAILFQGEDVNVRVNRSNLVSSVTTLGQTALVVGLMDVGRGDDTLKLWIDPNLVDEPDIHNHEPVFTLTGIDFAQKLNTIGVISYDISGNGNGGMVDHVRFATSPVAFMEEQTLSGLPLDFLEYVQRGQREITIPTLDISDQTQRHVIIAQGTEDVYHGHATTLLMPDNRTMFAVWNYGHGGRVGPLKRSDDAGLTWSEKLDVPESWRRVRNCPAIYRLKDPRGKARLFVFAGQGGPDDTMHQSYSEDDGRTWTPMQCNGLITVMPFCTIEPVEGGRRLLAMTNIRRPGETQERRSNVVARSFSDDGGLSWSELEIVADIRGGVPCEPWLVPSPDGEQLIVILRENNRAWNSWMMVSDDGGRTWSEPRQLHASLTGDRHAARYTSDGRLFIAFRDVASQSPTRNHYVGWVGTYDDLLEGREGQYRVKLLHSHAGWDCGYAAVEVLPDDTLIATTYIKYRSGPEQHSVVSTRFRLDELDAMLEAGR